MYYQLAIEALEYPEQQSDGEGANNSPSKSHHTLFLVSSSIPRASRSAASLRDLTVIDEEKKTPCFSTPPRKALRRTILSTSPASPSLYSNDGNDTEQIWSPEVKIGTPRHPLSKLTYLSPIPTSLRTATDTSVTANALKSSVSSQHSATARTRIGNFNAALDVFADMLAEHSASAARFKQKVLKKQSEEYSPASFPASRQLGGDRRGSGHRSVGEPGGDVGVPGSPGGSRMSWEEMVLRIDQLRARNWEMPGFDAEYYRGLCERAMEDLGG
jgi:hypothetical protein